MFIKTAVTTNNSQRYSAGLNDKVLLAEFNIADLQGTIKNELSELDGVKSVDGNPEAKSIDIEWEAPITEDKILETLKEINYPAA